MINVYKKVEKSKDYPSGYMEISDSELDKPFLLCISAQDNFDKSIFGTIRQGVQAARVYNTKDFGAGYKVLKFPVDFLGFRFVKDDEKINNAVEIVNRFLYPYLIKNGLDIEKLVEQSRKMNFMTYCDGTITYKKIEDELIRHLSIDGLSKEDIKTIISNIHLVSIGTMVDTNDFECSNISLIDVNDREIWNDFIFDTKENMENNNEDYVYGKYNNQKSGYYFYNGTGRHNLLEYFRDGVLVKPVLYYIIGKVLDTSIKNEKLTIDEIINLLNNFVKKGSQEELLNIIDNSINYGDAPKYSSDELNLRLELDELYSSYKKEVMEKKMLQKENEKNIQDKNRMIDAIKNYSSDITFYQILVGCGLWQTDINPYDFPSDREIREKLKEEEINSNLKR